MWSYAVAEHTSASGQSRRVIDIQATSWSPPALAAQGPLDIEAVYQAYGRELLAMFYARCCDAHLAQDALHEAVMRLCKHRGGGVSNPKAWLLRVGQNWLIDVSRKSSSAMLATVNVESLVGTAASPCTQAMDEESRDLFRKALAGLSSADRKILSLKYALAWKSQRIAAAENSTPGAIDMRLSRARQRFAEALRGLGALP